MDVGGGLLSALVAQGDILLYRKLNLSEQFFYGDEVEPYQFVAAHVAKYGALPKIKTLTEMFSEMPEPVEPVKYYADLVEQRFIHKRLNTALTECQGHMKEQDTFTAMNVITEAMAHIRTAQARAQMMEFMTEGHDLYMAQYAKAKLAQHVEVYTGLPTLDAFGPMRGGDVLSIVGRPAMGKTFNLLAMAMDAAQTQGAPVLFVSMEMPLVEIMERQVAMYAHYPMTHIQNYELSTTQSKSLPVILKKAKDEKGRCWVVEGNFASTVDDIASLAHQLAPRAVYVDGAYLTEHPDKRFDMSKRVNANAMLFKRRALELGIPFFLSYQFNRDVEKLNQKKDGGKKKGLSNVMWSDSVAQISSVVLGLFEEESVETLIARTVEVLKGRKGQIGSLRQNWNFQTMDFTEIKDEADLKKGVLQFA